MERPNFDDYIDGANVDIESYSEAQDEYITVLEREQDTLAEEFHILTIGKDELFDLCEKKEKQVEMYRTSDPHQMIAELKDFCKWMTGCGYDFTQHEYFIKKRDELLK